MPEATATDELQCLMNFNQNISPAMARTMQHLYLLLWQDEMPIWATSDLI